MSPGSTQRKYSQPAISSPLSSSMSNNSKPSNQPLSLPSTPDLQRYVNAYIQYFHPHMPFLHIPTLSFDSPTYTSHVKPGTSHPAYNNGSDAIIGGGGCLILSMAAIGALHEFERVAAKDLFDAAKKMILYYLEERRRAGLSAVVNGASNRSQDSSSQSPLWLVQAMLLNLIYGHTSGDKQAAEVASTHCAALVSLARAADLDKPVSSSPPSTAHARPNDDGDHPMSDDVGSNSNQQQQHEDQKTNQADEHARWLEWKLKEERKRTFYAVFLHSCAIVSAYARPPGILNSEIRLDLPCEEDLWAAENAQTWAAIGRTQGVQSQSVSFSDALAFLLGASQRQHLSQPDQHSYINAFGVRDPMTDLPESDLKPSSFGCLILINALHVYIWETRQRHSARHWKVHEMAAMHAQIEPALKAWQAAWASNPRHTLERPNTFGPLGPDCIPMLDLAYIHLYVDLSRAKEAFWNRDFDAVATELAKGRDIVHNAEESPDPLNNDFPADGTLPTTMSTSSPGINADGTTDGPAGASVLIHSSKRERRLRKVAFYAADSLIMAGRQSVTYSEFTARDLPIQSAMCTYECAQVLSEWIATVQERVGRYLGILGKTQIDFGQVPAIVLLEEEDVKLFEKLEDILANADLKIQMEMGRMGGSQSLSGWEGLSALADAGYGEKLLLVTAHMLENAAVWPTAAILARALEVMAKHSHQRAETSVAAA